MTDNLELKPGRTQTEESALQSPKDAQETDSLTKGLDIDTCVTQGIEPDTAIEARLSVMQQARNPLLEAAKPLILAMAQLPEQFFHSDGQIAVFRQLLAREVQTFMHLCQRVHIPREHMIAVSYTLCSGIDEFANHTVWGGSKNGGAGVWSTQMLAAQFHGDTQGGKKVFMLIGRLMQQAPNNIALLDVLYRIISLGVEGQYRNQPNGRRDVDLLRAHMYHELAKARGPLPLALSPHSEGVRPQRLRMLRSLPVWVSAVVLSLVVFALFSWFKYQLSVQSNALQEKVVAIGKLGPPPAPPATSIAWDALLREEIAAGLVSIIDQGADRVIRFHGDAMFVQGLAGVSPQMLPLLDKVAQQLARLDLPLQVIGHTDNVPISTPKFPNNQMLSQERAASVADVLQTHGVPAARLSVSGMGERQPIAGNATAAQRAQNRRVELHIPLQSAPPSQAVGASH